MKTKNDPRHKKRQDIVKNLFAYSFTEDNPKSPLVAAIVQHKETIDPAIERIAPEFPIEKLNRVDLAILRLAVYELTIDKKEPAKVIIDEAIELAKEFGGDNSPAFINGALGKLLKDKMIANKDHENTNVQK